VIDIYHELKSFDMDVDVYDPWASADEVRHEYGIDIISGEKAPNLANYSAVILAVAHKQFINLNIQKSSDQVVYDVKGFIEKSRVDARL
jgi:UDP-N-acetyl-D-galactosamine dehydrogenase